MLFRSTEEKTVQIPAFKVVSVFDVSQTEGEPLSSIAVSLDCDNGIENAILLKPQSPETLLEEKQLREQLYAAVMTLPEKQAKRIYARYYLGMRVSEIAAAEGVDPSRVRDSIRRGLKQLAKYF